MSIQQRLLQREPLDPWTVREQVCLASAVCRSGDQNWMSVSRQLRAAGDPARPQDWYQQKYCASQYGALLENAETPKRKKRASEGAAETPQEAILKRLTAERIAELQKLMAEEKAQYAVLKEEIAECRSPTTTDARLRELLAGEETARRQREREQQRHAQFLRDREERKRVADKNRKLPATPPAGESSSPPASSPLLTSLLKNASPGASVSQMLQVPRPGSAVDAVSPSASAPTLSMLLEKGREGVLATPPPAPVPVATESAVIEQIKSELQEIENNLRMGNMGAASAPAPPSTPALPSTPAPLDIDDIEIKAEDVYAFSDVALEIQPVSAIHKHVAPRSVEKPPTPSKKEEAEIAEAATESPVAEVEIPPPPAETAHEQQPVLHTEDIQSTAEPAVEVSETVEAESSGESRSTSPAETLIEDPAVNITISAPEEIVPPESDIYVTKEEEPLRPETGEDDPNASDEDDELNVTRVSEADSEPAENPQPDAQDASPELDATDKEEALEAPAQEPAPATNAPSAEHATKPPADESATVKIEIEEREEPGEAAEAASGGADAEPSPEPEPHKPLDADHHTETDDDTPMEVIREEEKGGRKRRDYSRRKTTLLSESSRGYSGSESAAESAPASPAAAPAPEPDREHRLWKKSVMLVYNRLCAHKYASLFTRPITDDMAPDYSLVVRRPMDLTTIKRNIDAGVIRTTAEFQRDVLLMLSNALFYNSSHHRVHHMAKDMHEEAAAQLGMLLQAQAHAALSDAAAEAPVRRAHAAAKRKRLSSPPAPAKRLKEE